MSKYIRTPNQNCHFQQQNDAGKLVNISTDSAYLYKYLILPTNENESKYSKNYRYLSKRYQNTNKKSLE